jgi:hypothetical protein
MAKTTHKTMVNLNMNQNKLYYKDTLPLAESNLLSLIISFKILKHCNKCRLYVKNIQSCQLSCINSILTTFQIVEITKKNHYSNKKLIVPHSEYH